jgi:hypothetical protein
MLPKNLIASNEFELFYLIELTKQKVKPLSRWEKPVSEHTREYIRKQGLYVDVIPRKTLLRYTIYETIFSTSSHYLDFYRRKFNHSLLRKDSQAKKLEGFLFGYPSCCVDQFIQKPYQKNGLAKEDQSILFHWACPDCRVTPELIPYYRLIHDRMEEWYNHKTFANKKEEEIYIRNYRRKFQTILAALLFSTGLLSGKINVDGTHFIPLKDDINNNGLSYAEEIYLGTHEYGLLNDCETYAIFFKAIIDTLPDSVQIDKKYKLEHYLRGVVQCPKCGESINMGYVTIINPLRNLKIDIPFLGLHFMENGYFSYGSDENYQRVDIDTLKRILFPYHPGHMLPVNGDKDNDGLTDAEEDSLWLDPNSKDQNGDGVPDGAQIAEELIRLFPKLKEEADSIHSHVRFQPVWGSENCEICGSIHNMGYIEIMNPENKRSCQIPYISLHSLAHGSFAYNGTVHQNQRTNAIELYRIMKTHMLFISDDSDNDGLKDYEEEYFGFDPNKADSNNDGICDGTELALKMVNKIESLPTDPSISEPYIEYIGMDGIHLCSVCGEEIVMELMNIYNPLINTTSPFEITSYAFHFMKKGSFACEGALEGRINPIELAHYLNINPSEIQHEIINNKPEEFILEQNYPNPFNPSTTIKFRLPASNYVSLKIYNLAGQEIETLVNEYRKAGEYEINLTAEGLPSGIYFFQLKAGKYSETKKLILLK